MWRPHVIRVHDKATDSDAIWGPYENAVDAGDAIPRVVAAMAELAGITDEDAAKRFQPRLHWLRSEELGN